MKTAIRLEILGSTGRPLSCDYDEYRSVIATARRIAGLLNIPVVFADANVDICVSCTDSVQDVVDRYYHIPRG